MVGAEQQLVEEAEAAAVAAESAINIAAVPSVSLTEAARGAGLSESEAELRQQELVGVSGVTHDPLPLCVCVCVCVCVCLSYSLSLAL
eukprot:COSAG03_NODE_13970_length_481_cov_3.722513_2_plen_87_part_01